MDKREQFKQSANDIMNSFISQPTQDKTEVKESKKENKEVIKSLATTTDILTNGYKYKNGKDRKDNFITTFKIDADLERYLINIASITLIDAVNNDNVNYSLTIQDYINGLIRSDLKARFNISNKEQDSQKWINAINDYCNKYKLKDVEPIKDKK